MTVSELIEKLRAMPQDRRVVVFDHEWCAGFDPEIRSVESLRELAAHADPQPEPCVVIHSRLPFR